MNQSETDHLDLLFKDPDAYRSALGASPLDASLHLNFALFCLTRDRIDLGFAELRTARSLGLDHPELDRLISEIEPREIPLQELDHNQYYRLTTLAETIHKLSESASPSVLDIGGGHGLLARFLPDASYFLVEPDVNGISAFELPFEEKSFDFVVACHVLEHIPGDQRFRFLDRLRAIARRHVIILNPFHLSGSAEEERLQMVYELTGASWAKEHLDCVLPRIEGIREYAENNDLTVDIQPNGTKSTSLALTLISHFANRCGQQTELRRVNRFFNTRIEAILQNADAPNAYLVHFDLRRQEKPDDG